MPEGGLGARALPNANACREGRLHLMQLLDGKFVCKHCGAPLDLPEGESPKVTFHAVSGEPLTRVLKVGTDELHSCEIAPRS